MKISIPKETKAYENRVAITPEVVKSLHKAGFQCLVETQAGINAHFLDAAYTQAGATIITDKEQLYGQTDVVLRVNAPTPEEVRLMQNGTVLICFLYAYTAPELLAVLQEKQISAFAMDAVPRISRAQKMDALSSQANLGGYKAVLLGANALGKIFPLLMTAAGTITPAMPGKYRPGTCKNNRS